MSRPTRNSLVALWFALAPALGFVLVVAADKADQAAANPNPKVATVPFEMLSSNHMVVNAKLNGKGPYRLVFDLGAPVTLLSNKAAEESGAVEKKAPRSFLFSMRGEGKIDTLEVGDLKAKDLTVLVFDHPVLKALAGFLGRPLDGIIGSIGTSIAPNTATDTDTAAD